MCQDQNSSRVDGQAWTVPSLTLAPLLALRLRLLEPSPELRLWLHHMTLRKPCARLRFPAPAATGLRLSATPGRRCPPPLARRQRVEKVLVANRGEIAVR